MHRWPRPHEDCQLSHRKRRMIRMMQVNDVNDVNATAVPAGCWNAALVALVAQVAQVAQADPLGTHLVAEEFHVPTGAKEPLRLAESSFGRQRWALHALLLPRQDLKGQRWPVSEVSEVRDMHSGTTWVWINTY